MDRVGDIQVGFGERFECFWFHLQRVAWAVLALLVLLGLAGVFGRGPLARATAGAEGAPLRVDYERFARFRTAAAWWRASPGARPWPRAR